MSETVTTDPRAKVDFSYLTGALLIYLLLNSAAHQFLDTELASPLLEGVLVLTLTTAVWSVRKQRPTFWTSIGLLGGVAVVAAAAILLDSSRLWVVHALLLLVLLSITARIALRQVLSANDIDWNSIAGAVCVYLLAGLIWAMLYIILELSAPGSFKGIATDHVGTQSMDLIYFSYISLTTVGYGDITPLSPLARFSSYVEGLFGQLYLAILVASLVGIKIARL